MPAPRTRVSDMDFVKAYAQSKSVGEVAKKLGISRNSVATRASSLRKKGVGLPVFVRAKRVVDVQGLNAVLKELGAYNAPAHAAKTPKAKKIRR